MAQPRVKVLVAGGGIAGLEALLALRALAEDRVELTLLAREPEFVYRPMLVEEPFSPAPAERRDLAAVAADQDADFVLGELSEMRPEAHRAVLAGGDEISFDVAVVCVGGRTRPAYSRARTLQSWAEPAAIRDGLTEAAGDPTHTAAFVVPPRISWSLPLYELALLSQRTAREQGLDVRIVVVTPEPSPLAIFGTRASEAVAEVLRGRGIDLLAGASVEQTEDDLVVHPGGEVLDTGVVISLPEILGPAVSGLPADEGGFIPIDEYANVAGVPDVFAAGDGTTFPIKQGGIATQQADAAAAVIAARAGAAVEPEPFRPVLRGKLITGDESLNLRGEVAGGRGEGAASLDYLWWPPEKVGGKYLAPYLAGAEPHGDLEPPVRSVDVEVALPAEWHREPGGLDPL